MVGWGINPILLLTAKKARLKYEWKEKEVIASESNAGTIWSAIKRVQLTLFSVLNGASG